MTERMTDPAPERPGFYYSEGAAQDTVYLRDRQGQWYALSSNAAITEVTWPYIAQTLSAYPLRRLDAETTVGVSMFGGLSPFAPDSES